MDNERNFIKSLIEYLEDEEVVSEDSRIITGH
jgi:hypothetical protein